MLYYTLRNGKIVDEYDLKKAYEIVSGKMFIDDAVGYSKFLYGLCGGSVVKAMNESDVSIEELIHGNAIIQAVRLYREKNGCGLREAKEAVDKIREEMQCIADKT